MIEMEPHKEEEGVLRIDEDLFVSSIRDNEKFLRQRASFTKKYPSEYSDFIFKLIKIATKKGRMGYLVRPGTCVLCGKGENIIRYQSGKNKGDIDFNKTWYSNMLDLIDNFVHIKNSTPSGVCEQCRKGGFDEELKKVLSSHEFIFEWDDRITPCSYIKDNKIICSNCDKEVWESEMHKTKETLGSAVYPSVCPHCNTESVLSDRSQITINDITNKTSGTINSIPINFLNIYFTPYSFSYINLIVRSTTLHKVLRMFQDQVPVYSHRTPLRLHKDM